MNDALPMTRGMSKENARGYHLSWRLQLFIARLACAVVATVGFVAGFALAQSQATPTLSSRPRASRPQQTSPSETQGKRQVPPAVIPVSKAVILSSQEPKKYLRQEFGGAKAKAD